MGAAVIVLGAGSGSRVGAARNKVLLPLAGRPVLAWSVASALAAPEVTVVVVVARPGEEDDVAAALGDLAPAPGPELRLVTGGTTRHASEWRALRAVAPEVRGGQVDVVAVHDGARPLAGTDLFARVLDAARRRGGAIPAVPATGLLDAEDRVVSGPLAAVQTPQAFRAGPLLAAYEAAAAAGFEGTDTAACLAAHGDLALHAVPGSARNLKVTWPGDLAVAEALVADGATPTPG